MNWRTEGRSAGCLEADDVFYELANSVFHEVALLVFAPTGHALRDSSLTCSGRAMIEIRTCSGGSDEGWS